MPKPISLEQLKRDAEVRDILRWPLDFDLVVSANETGWFSVTPNAEMSVIARDGAGGLFLLYGAHQYLLHITSEGQAGVIARDLTEGIQLMVAFPYWQDLLKFSGGGQLNEMRRVAPYLERCLAENEPRIAQYQKTLKQQLSLEEACDPIASLHTAVSVLSSGIDVLAPDGTKFDSLFNTFTVESNPTWARAVEGK